jgi:phytoene dehydrogenase-like protein
LISVAFACSAGVVQFGMHKGSIHHGALSLHQLYAARPMHAWSNHRTPLAGLYLVGCGAHPGGGVMGAAGRNGAQVVLGDMRIRFRGV